METVEIFEVGDKVKHAKFGSGTVTFRAGEGDKAKVTVKFGAEYGEKKLVVSFAKLKKMNERPTLAVQPEAPAVQAEVLAVEPEEEAKEVEEPAVEA